MTLSKSVQFTAALSKWCQKKKRKVGEARSRRQFRPFLERLEEREVPSAVNLFSVPTPNSMPSGITAGLDGNLWFTESQADKIASINPTTHAIQEFQIPTGLHGPGNIITGPDGNLWFTLSGNADVVRFNPPTHIFTTFTIGAPALDLTFAPAIDFFDLPYPVLWLTEPGAHQMQVYDPTTRSIVQTLPFDHSWAISSDGHRLWFTNIDPVNGDWIGMYDFLIVPNFQSAISIPTVHCTPTGITEDAQSNAWFTEFGTNKIGEVDALTLNVTEFTIPTFNGQLCEPDRITLGSDGNLWFTEFMATQTANGSYVDHIGMINSKTHAITQIALPLAPGAFSAGAKPTGITAGPDGNIWFTEQGILASQEFPQTGNAIGEVVLNNGFVFPHGIGSYVQFLLGTGTIPPAPWIKSFLDSRLLPSEPIQPPEPVFLPVPVFPPEPFFPPELQHGNQLALGNKRVVGFTALHSPVDGAELLDLFAAMVGRV